MTRRKPKNYHNGSAPGYPWDKWFGYQRSYNLVKGTDYVCANYVMAQQIRNKASKKNLQVEIKITPRGLTVRNL